MKNLLIIFLFTVSISANEQIPAPPQKKSNSIKKWTYSYCFKWYC